METMRSHHRAQLKGSLECRNALPRAGVPNFADRRPITPAGRQPAQLRRVIKRLLLNLLLQQAYKTRQMKRVAKLTRAVLRLANALMQSVGRAAQAVKVQFC